MNTGIAVFYMVLVVSGFVLFWLSMRNVKDRYFKQASIYNGVKVHHAYSKRGGLGQIRGSLLASGWTEIKKDEYIQLRKRNEKDGYSFLNSRSDYI